MNVGEQRRRCRDFEAAFNALGTETRGMTSVAACVLLAAAIDYGRDEQKGGYMPIPTGTPTFALGLWNKSTVDILTDYPNCHDFWEIDKNQFRARITQAGVDYVNRHVDMFSIWVGDEND